MALFGPPTWLEALPKSIGEENTIDGTSRVMGDDLPMPRARHDDPNVPPLQENTEQDSESPNNVLLVGFVMLH
jgi:hypothetical protein